MVRFRYNIIFFSVLLMMIVSCGEPLPIKEMAAAKKEISRAQSVKADTYAPEELEKAYDELLNSHKELKKDDIKKAAKAAEESKEYAVAAFNKAVPLLAKDAIQIAENSLQEASEAYAEILAKEEYDNAKAELEKAQTLFQNKDYYNAYLAAVEADKLAKDALNSANDKKYLLSDSIAEVKVTLEEAKKYGAETVAPEKVKLAEENLAIAEEANVESELKKGFAAIEIAKLNADEALQAAMEAAAKKKLAECEVLIEKAEKSPNSQNANDEMAAAKESYENAKDFLDDTKYKDSITASEEAMRLATIVMNAKKTDTTGDDTSTVATKDKDKDTGEGSVEGEDDYILYTVVYRQRLRDCLWRISGKFYKNPRLWKIIYQANKDKIKNPHLIYPGWVLKIPKKYIK